MPYQVWSAQQGASLNRSLTPSIVPVKQTKVDLKPMASDWRAVELASWLERRSQQRGEFTWHKIQRTLGFYFQSVLYLPLIALLLPFGHRKLWTLLTAAGLVLIGTCTHLSAGHPHYVAGLTPIFAILAATGLRKLHIQLGVWGRAVVGMTLAAWLLLALAAILMEAIDSPHERAHAWAKRRIELARRLDAYPGKQIVFVRYAAEHSVHQEWVYNSADIDSQNVIWANDLASTRNRRLLEYYRDQGAPASGWILLVGESSERLLPLRRLQ